MIQFFKESVRELKHVVWPTKEETKSFFTIVIVILVLFWIYLFIADSIFAQGILSLREFFIPIK